MKVIVERHKHVKRLDCPNCKSTLEYSLVDVQEEVVGQRGEVRHYLTCPVCKHSIYGYEILAEQFTSTHSGKQETMHALNNLMEEDNTGDKHNNMSVTTHSGEMEIIMH